MISQNLNRVKESLSEGVRLVAVSKYHPVAELQEAYDAGQRVFGESHVQELVAKYEVLPKDIEWHFIGHLQTNKVKYLAPFVSLIHAVDSMKLLREIDKQAQKCGRVIDCLLQLHVAQEETKFGFAPDELLDVLSQEEWRELHGVRVVGLMCMATNTDDEAQIHSEFRLAYDTFCKVRDKYFPAEASFRELSMGMSGDYLIAQQEHSTMVRVGSMIFGERDYSKPFTAV
ncbi:MAG: YggS family pyridoxal phosphate-dependent enzyme [Bacteroidaceae bacterium]|nr:YggS family pyridoxal phosphate-dependent enzyme [Bacteroidaceae bacterium]